MAAPKSDETNRLQRRLAMIGFRRKGKSYRWIANKFEVKPPTVREIILRACSNIDPKGLSDGRY